MPRLYIPSPGTFCKALLNIPDGVTTAAYPQSVLSTGSTSIAADPGPRSRLCYVKQRTGKLFSVYFCTTFGGNHISTQFSDHPEKRDKFLAIAPTPSHNDNTPLVTSPDWDRTPAYLCLGPSVEVEARHTQAPNQRPPPKLSSEERKRLDRLIAEMNPDYTDSTSSDTPSTEDYDEAFPPLGAKRPASTSGNVAKTAKSRKGADASTTRTTQLNRNYKNILAWTESVGKDGAAYKAGTFAGYDSDEEGFSPQQYLEARLNPTKIPQVIFSSDLSDVALDEIDPSAEFIKEAIRFNAVRTC